MGYGLPWALPADEQYRVVSEGRTQMQDTQERRARRQRRKHGIPDVPQRDDDSWDRAVETGGGDLT